ncbi:MAG: transaldolase, partial [Actinobacteria bacterium]|nr:transaldolase [Actinomycetota bacterium]
MNRLQRLYAECGQSPWLDNLRRGWITGGQLAALRDRGVRGLTSNPTIFQKAIQGSSDYDEQFSALTRSNVAPRDAYWSLVLRDIDSALDVFAPVYEASGGEDGFVSVEVDPTLAHDSAGTLTSARDLHQRVDRPNVMIK